MKSFNSKFFLTLAIALFAIGLFLSSCEGPAGPAGKDGLAGAAGANGKDGVDGSKPCQACHNNANQDFYTKWYQYKLSLHGEGEVWIEEANRVGSCGGCHSGDGFASASANGTNTPTNYDYPTPITCRTCHFIHTKYDSTDFALRWTQAVPMLQKLATDPATFDFKGSGNLCAKCHQSRTITRTPSKLMAGFDSIARSTSGYSRVGPHYGIIANIVSAIGIPPMAGVTYGTADNNPHADKLAKGCVTCHMGVDTTNFGIGGGGHYFQMTQASYQRMSTADFNANCNSCHSKKVLLDAVNSKAIAADIVKIRRKIIDLGLLDTSQAFHPDGTYFVVGEYVKASTTGPKYVGTDTITAMINYLHVAKDRSNGAHNPTMIKSIVAGLKTFFGVQ
ncbi:MAG: hypothetical protein HW421_964 [Ignavibacteria bacterium]|nr:hypothetical protein [Ignavibacteria bacterium]